MALSPPGLSNSRLGSIASLRAVHEAFRWLHLNPGVILDWQRQLVAIPAPPFGEQERSAWMEQRFLEAGLASVVRDEVGNAIGLLPASGQPGGGACVVLSAHIDTVFPRETPLAVRLEGSRLEAPGACDNAAGVAGLLAIARALRAAEVPLPADIYFVANVGEEGEGDLRGIRHLYSAAPFRGRIGAHLVLDGAGHRVAVSHALGCLRYRLEVTGPGGHSFTDAGMPNPIHALAAAVAALAALPLSEQPRATLSFGTIRGGTSVNSIPELASATVDLRSTDAAELARLRAAVEQALEQAVREANRAAGAARGELRSGLVKIGDRPAAELPAGSPLLEALAAVDRHLRIRTELRLGSTDANIPLSLGVPALSLGAGGSGGNAHTRAEWYDAGGRDLGLRRVLLLLLLVAARAAEGSLGGEAP